MKQYEHDSKTSRSVASIPVQKKDNKTGLPDNLKSGIEQLSGVDMSSVQVKRNSSEPAKVGALAYAQGSEIHLGPGQEKHLPHEAWHVVQQSQGRVKPTTSINGKAVNDSPGLEKEADVMGVKALQARFAQTDELDRLSLKKQGIQYKVGQTAQLTVAPDHAQHYEMEGLATWSEPVQFKANGMTIQLVRADNGLSLTVQDGDYRQVTQYMFEDWFAAAQGTLLMVEALTAVVGAGLAFSASKGGIGVGLIAIGLTKFVRGILSFHDARGGDAEESKKIAARIRILEAFVSDVLAIITLANADASLWTKASASVFALIKSIRSIIQLIDPGGDYTVYIVNILQALEGVALFIGGMAAAVGGEAAGAIGIVGGVSKGGRGGLGIAKAQKSGGSDDSGGGDSSVDGSSGSDSEV